MPVDPRVVALLADLDETPNGMDWRTDLVTRHGEAVVSAAEVASLVFHQGYLTRINPAGSAALMVARDGDAA